MRLLLLFLIFSLELHSQHIYRDSIKIYSNRYMDSIAKASIKYSMSNQSDGKLVTVWASPYIKLTASARFNTTPSGYKFMHQIVYDKISEPEITDYLNVLTYDIRLKGYINKYNGLILKTFANGSVPKRNIYSLGWAYKL